MKTQKTLCALGVLLTAEGLFILGTAVWFFIELLTVTPQSYGSAIAIFVLTLAAAIGILATAINTFRGRAWIRAAAVTWQVTQIAVAAGFVNGGSQESNYGWPLLFSAVAALILLFTPSVVEVTKRTPSQPS